MALSFGYDDFALGDRKRHVTPEAAAIEAQKNHR
jgi:hypothetical protein